MLDVIDTARYAGAAALLTRANQSTAETGSMLFDAITDAAQCAGRTRGAATWSDAYRTSAETVTGQLARLVDAFGTAARLLDASGHNHARAEAAAAPYGMPSYALPQRALCSIGLVGVPPVYGGDADQPHGWGLIAAHLDGYLWPGADLDRMRTLAAAWHRAAERLRDLEYYPAQAAAELEQLSAAELPDAVTACQRLGKATLALADECDSLGSACTSFAREVQRQRDPVQHAVVEFFAALGISEVAGDVLSVVTSGLSKLVARAVQSGLFATYAARITGLLGDLEGALPGLAPAASAGTDEAWLAAMARAEPVMAQVDASASAMEAGIDASTGRALAGGLRTGMTDAEVIDAGWARRNTLQDHFTRHGRDVGAQTEAEYVRAAQQFRQRALQEGLPTKIAPDGTVRIFDPETNIFASYRSDGLARTIFRPKPAPTEYWASQPGELQ